MRMTAVNTEENRSRQANNSKADITHLRSTYSTVEKHLEEQCNEGLEQTSDETFMGVILAFFYVEGHV